MKIIVNARFLTQHITGVQRYALECSRYIFANHKDVVFVAPHNILHPEIAKELNVHIVGTKTGHIWEQIDLVHYLKKMDNPPLLCLANTAPIFYNNNYFCLHDLAFEQKPRTHSFIFNTAYRFFIPFLVKKARHIFTVSQTMKTEIVNHYSLKDDKVSITYNGIGSHFLMVSRIAKKEKYMLYVGSFLTRKNVKNLVEAFLKGGFEKSGYKLVLIGKQTKSHHLRDVNGIQNNNIEIIENAKDEDLVMWYQKSEVLVSLSGYEGFNIPILEALYFGCKVLCSDIPTHKELFKEVCNYCNQLDINDIIIKLKCVIAGEFPNKSIIDSKLIEYSFERSAHHILTTINNKH